MQPFFLLLYALASDAADAPRSVEPETAPSPMEAGRIVFDEENDALVPGDNTDRYYTQGLRLQLWWSVFDAEERANLFDTLIPFDVGQPDSAMVGMTFGQSIYTPESFKTTTRASLNGDRPFGGWAYIGAAALGSWSGPRPGMGRRLLMEIDVGTYGDWSLAGPLQVGMHRLLREANPDCWNVDVPVEGCRPLDPPGWHHPEINISHGVGVNALVKLENDVFAATFSTLPAVGGKVALLVECTVGSVFDICGAGVVTRAGWNPDDLDAGVNSSNKIAPEAMSDPRAFGAWVFGRAEGLVIGYNRFLDNDPFDRDAVRAERNLAIGELELGAMARLLGAELGGSVFMRTPELTSPPTGNGVQIVGRFRVGFFF